MMTAEQRAAQSEKMKANWAERKAAKKAADPAIREAMANVPMNAPVDTINSEINRITNEVIATNMSVIADYVFGPNRIIVEVDWEKTPMLEAQRYYAQLKGEFEKAGRILNARSMERISGYTCFMCHKHFDGAPKFTDHSYVDPQTGLSPRVDCCGELCVINYNSMRITQRHERDTAARAAEQERR